MKKHQLIDLHPRAESVRQIVLTGLSKTEKEIPSKLLYDKRGSELFEQITLQPEYYQTRSELALLRKADGDLAKWIGSSALIVELGSGDPRKIQILLEQLKMTEGKFVYMPVDISKEYLEESSLRVAEQFPLLDVVAVCADFLQFKTLPTLSESLRTKKNVVFFPGSTIGNFEPQTRGKILEHVAELVGPGGGFLVGADLKKDPLLLHKAYNDAAGITAEFELNILDRLNGSLSADFDKNAFYYEGFYNEAMSRVEMYIVSKKKQTAHVDGVEVFFDSGERIHLENSYKWTEPEFLELCRRFSFKLVNSWTDALFGLWAFTAQ